MGTYTNIVGRTAVADALMPDQVVDGIIKDATTESIMLRRAKQVRMTSKKAKQAVLSTLPDAYWVDGDNGLKQTGEAAWKNITITAEELAVIVPIPDAVLDDTNVPLWDQVKPLIAEAIGKKVDQAALGSSPHARGSLLDRAQSIRSIAKELGRSPSSVSREVKRHRVIVAPKAMYAEPAPDKDTLKDVCPGFLVSPYCCNSCKRKGGYGCSRYPKVRYVARLAQREADSKLKESREGIDGAESEVPSNLILSTAV